MQLFLKSFKGGCSAGRTVLGTVNVQIVWLYFLVLINWDRCLAYFLCIKNHGETKSFRFWEPASKV